MSRPPSDLPERLLTTDATDFERQVIEAARSRKPSSSASTRMARALGIAVTGAVTSFPTKAQGTPAAAPKLATAVAGTATVSPWISVGLLGLAIGGAVVGVRAWRASRPEPAPPALTSPAQPAPVTSQPIRRPSPIAEPVPAPLAAVHRSHVSAAALDLRGEIAFLDAARAAVSAGDGRRALEILRRYGDKYPSETFRPEATAVQIEALVKLDRRAEARELAARFVTENRGTLLAGRVAALVGLTTSSTPP
jgi:hypothetical protein